MGKLCITIFSLASKYHQKNMQSVLKTVGFGKVSIEKSVQR